VEYRPGANERELMELVGDADVLVFRSRVKVGRSIIDAAKRLKVLARYGIGLDNVDVGYALSRGIAVVNAPRASAVSVAELTIGLMIVLLRGLHIHIESVKRGLWSKGAVIGRELYGKRLGVIGFGNIGSLVASYARSLGMEVWVNDVADERCRAAAEQGFRVAEFEELLKECDIITLHVPLTPKTYRMINDETLRLVRDGAYIINTSRGEVIEADALLKHLDRLGGVALDVLEEEPPRSEKLAKLIAHPKVVVTPHIGAETVEAQERIADELFENIVRALEWVKHG